MVDSWVSGFVADVGEQDHKDEEADADEDVGDVLHVAGWVFVRDTKS
jgi:hypothetical protein